MLPTEQVYIRGTSGISLKLQMIPLPIISSIVTARMAQSFSTTFANLEKLCMSVCACSCVYVT